MAENNRDSSTNSTQRNAPNDEWFEKKEQELAKTKRQLGKEIYSLTHGAASILPSRKKNAAHLKIDLLRTECALAEVREIRRALLGLSYNAHIRSRALPNFVANNPSYARVVADEIHIDESILNQI